MCATSNYSNVNSNFSGVIFLRVHSFLLIPSNTQQSLLSMNIAYWLWCWWLAGVYPWFFAVGIVEVDPLIIASNNGMQKCLFFKRLNFSPFNVSFNSYGIHFLCFWIFPIALKRLEIILWPTPNANFFRIWVESSSSNACNSASSNFFGGFRRSLLLRSKSPLLKRQN